MPFYHWGKDLFTYLCLHNTKIIIQSYYKEKLSNILYYFHFERKSIKNIPIFSPLKSQTSFQYGQSIPQMMLIFQQ